MQTSDGTSLVVRSHLAAIFLVTFLAAGVSFGDSSGPIDVTEPNLHDADKVYGRLVSTMEGPYLNQRDIFLLALGETDPNRYTDVSFKAYGLYCDVNDMYMVNTGAIDVNAIGGHAISNSTAFADVDAYGIHAKGGVNNIGVLTVTAAGGTADTNDEADADAEAYGILAREDVNNVDAVTVTARGGTADANDGADADAEAYAGGIGAEGYVTNNGSLTVTARGGTAHADGDADTDAHAYGVGSDGYVTNSGPLTVTTVGGVADANDEADAYAETYGIVSYLGLANTGAIAAAATGGTADANNIADAYAAAHGIYSYGDIDNAGDIDVNALGGTATASTGRARAKAYAYGLDSDSGDVNNTGDITVTATGGTAAANDEIYAYADASGVYSGGDLHNTGAIDLNALGGLATASTGIADANAYAYGLESDSGEVTNTGAITIMATGGTADANDEAYANVETYGVYTDGEVSNTGALTFTAMAGTANGNTLAAADVNAVGVYGLVDVNNTGVITVTATGGTADANDEASGYADAYGVYADGDVNNAGAITVTATAGTAGINDGTSALASSYISGIETGGDVNNIGAISITAIGGAADANNGASAFARANAAGIDAEGDVTNTGAITVMSTGGTADANDEASTHTYAYGIYADGAVTNAGALTVTATGGTANAKDEARAQAHAGGITSWESAVTNTGVVTVVATAGTVNARGDANASAEAWGISADGGIDNSGALVITAHGGTVTGSDDYNASSVAFGLYSEAVDATVSDVNNSGNITVTATAQEGSTSYAYGIYLAGDGALTNTGTIRTSADRAYEVYVAPDTTTTLVDTYNVTLDGDPNEASVYVGDGATLELNDASLTVTYANRETIWDTDYRLFEVDSNGVVDGNFADAQAANPNTTVTYYDQGTAGSADDAVALSYTPDASGTPGSSAVERQVVFQAGDVVNRRMTGTLLKNVLSLTTSPLLASAGSTAESMRLARSASDKTTGFYVEPYYSRLSKDANPLGYKARLWGFSAGYEQSVENTLLGLHAGYGQSDIDYTGTGFSANREDQDILTAGLTGLTRWDPWTLRYGITGFYGWHDYSGLTGLSLDECETASYSSYGAIATVMAGRIIRRDKHVFLPEAGLSYLWAHRPGYTTEAADPSWNTTYSTLDDHDVQAEAALRWLSSFMHGNVHVTPSASVGVRHLLTDDEASVWLSVPGAAPVLVRSERDRTALTLSGSVALTKARRALSLAYDGEYSDDSRRHSLWLRFSWLF